MEAALEAQCRQLQPGQSESARPAQPERSQRAQSPYRTPGKILNSLPVEHHTSYKKQPSHSPQTFIGIQPRHFSTHLFQHIYIGLPQTAISLIEPQNAVNLRAVDAVLEL
ncbi:MAG TPA: hypothetical protein VGU23_04255, partial [Acidobacteriaceae bacterium]|nr:hypothetical protein [Acidobacteriaceae bacterium]